MGHKALIGGAEYEIVGGKTLVNGASYSIANGKVLIDGAEYDIPFKVTDYENLWDGDDTELAAVNCVIHANGYWVVGGSHVKNSVCYACIAYTTNLRDWTVKDLWQYSEADKTAATIKCIEYADGYWMVGGCLYNGPSSDLTTAMFGYSTSPDGQWRSLGLWSGASLQRPNGYDYDACVNCIKFAEDFVVVGGNTNSSGRFPKIMFASIYSFTNTILWDEVSSELSSYANSFNCIEYANGYWCLGGVKIIFGDTDEGYSYSRSEGVIAYTTSLSGTWITKTLIASPDGGMPIRPYGDAGITCIKYVNGTWAFGGFKLPPDGSSDVGCYAIMLSCESLGGSTTEILSRRIFGTSLMPISVSSIAYDNDYWAVGIKNKDIDPEITNISDSEDTAVVLYRYGNTWTQIDMWEPGSINCMTYADGYWFCGGRYNNFARIAWAKKRVTNYEKLQLM